MATNKWLPLLGGEVIRLISLIGLIRLIRLIALNQSCNNILAVTWEHINDWNLRHCIATWSKAHTCTCHVNKYLCCERRVIDRHIEREVLVVGLTTHTLTSHVNTMTNIVQSCNAWYCKYV